MNRWLIACLTLLWSPAVAAQPTLADRENEEICLTIGTWWSGTLNETRDLRATPVPASFRAIMDRGGCPRMQIIKQSLIDWHIAFGDEPSTTAALSYLHAELLRDLPEPSRYAQALRQARQGRLQHLSNAKYDYQQVAQTALTAAEEFGSLPLLARAETAVAALQGRVEVLRAADSAASERSNLAGDESLVTELRMRTSVLRADLTRSETDITLADRLLRSVEQPHFTTVAEVAYSGGNDFCDISGGWGAKAEAAEQACRDDHDLPQKVVGYWRNRAMLDLVMAVPASRSDELALRLVEREIMSGTGRCCRFDGESDLLRLRLMQSDRHRRAFADRRPGNGDDGYLDWSKALDYLGQAERMTHPAEKPARFRRIAERWLAIWDRAEAVKESLDRHRDRPKFLRHAAYLRRLLPHLDAITVGAIDP